MNLEEIAGKLNSGQPFEALITPWRAFNLVAALQLALRHPGLKNQPFATSEMRSMARNLQRKLGEIDPAIATVLEQGWHPEFDVPVDMPVESKSISPRGSIYPELSQEIQEEMLLNSIALKLACAGLAHALDANFEDVVAKISDEANDGLNSLSPEQVSASIARMDLDRQYSLESVIGIPSPHQNPYYAPPFGIPLRWQDEASGRLVEAIETYANHVADTANLAPTPEQLMLIRQYLKYYINAPCWDGTCDALSSLRQQVTQLETVADISDWTAQCHAQNIDPL
ncbi:MAG: hypothetical protein WCA35_22780 [Kovacikia sp.]